MMLWGSRNGELWRAGPRLSSSLGTVSKKVKVKGRQGPERKGRTFRADRTACVKAYSAVTISGACRWRMRSKAGRDVQAHNTDSPTKKRGLESVGNKKPQQTPKACRILATAPQLPIVIYGAQIHGTLFLPPHHQHQSPSFTITYDS